MKDILFVFVLLVSICTSVILFRFNQEKAKVEKNLQQERYNRIVAEENSEKNVAQIHRLEKELKGAQDKFAQIENILDQQKDVNADLRAQFEKIEAAKLELEAKLQSALEGQTNVTTDAGIQPQSK